MRNKVQVTFIVCNRYDKLATNAGYVPRCFVCRDVTKSLFGFSIFIKLKSIKQFGKRSEFQYPIIYLFIAYLMTRSIASNDSN
jgi:hypothetical protein